MRLRSDSPRLFARSLAINPHLVSKVSAAFFLSGAASNRTTRRPHIGHPGVITDPRGGTVLIWLRWRALQKKAASPPLGEVALRPLSPQLMQAVVAHNTSAFSINSQSGLSIVKFRSETNDFPSSGKSNNRPTMWYRNCPQCDRRLLKHHLEQTVTCMCGWAWRDSLIPERRVDGRQIRLWIREFDDEDQFLTDGPSEVN